MAKRRAIIGSLALAPLAGLVLSACSNTQASINRIPQSGSATASLVNGVQTVTLTTDNHDRFVPDTITVHPGVVRIVLDDTGTTQHEWSLNGFPSDYVPLTVGGQTRSTTFVAPAPGRYEFICAIHLPQGQTGTLIVLPN